MDKASITNHEHWRFPQPIINAIINAPNNALVYETVINHIRSLSLSTKSPESRPETVAEWNAYFKQIEPQKAKETPTKIHLLDASLSLIRNPRIIIVLAIMDWLRIDDATEYLKLIHKLLAHGGGTDRPKKYTHTITYDCTLRLTGTATTSIEEPLDYEKASKLETIQPPVKPQEAFYLHISDQNIQSSEIAPKTEEWTRKAMLSTRANIIGFIMTREHKNAFHYTTHSNTTPKKTDIGCQTAALITACKHAPWLLSIADIITTRYAPEDICPGVISEQTQEKIIAEAPPILVQALKLQEAVMGRRITVDNRAERFKLATIPDITFSIDLPTRTIEYKIDPKPVAEEQAKSKTPARKKKATDTNDNAENTIASDVADAIDTANNELITATELHATIELHDIITADDAARAAARELAELNRRQRPARANPATPAANIPEPAIATDNAF